MLLLARGGHPIYAGAADKMLAHFAAQGYECPRHVNPADFALDLITVDLQHESREAASKEKVRRLIESWNAEVYPVASSGSIATPAELGSMAREPTSFASAYSILIRRATKNMFRQPEILIARIMQVVGLGIVLSLYFAPLHNDYFAVQNRLGFLIEIGPLYFVGSKFVVCYTRMALILIRIVLNNIAVYPTERDVFERDFLDRIYGVEAFFLTYISITTPFEIISCLIFSLLAVFACDLRRNAQTYFIISFNAFCVTSCGESLGIAFNTLFTHTGFSVNCMSVFLSVAQIMGGVMSLDIPDFLQAWNHLSPIKYAIGNMAPYTLRGLDFTCEDWQRVNGQCPIESGEQVLDLYKLNGNPEMNLMALGICAIVYRFLAYVVLKVVKERWIGKLWRKLGGGKKQVIQNERSEETVS
jgi:hypothetical protein